MLHELARVPTIVLHCAHCEPTLIPQECLELLYNDALARDRLGIGYQLAQERHPCRCSPSQALTNVLAGPPSATSVQRAPAPGRSPDHLAGYLPPASEIGLKNNGE